MLKANIEIKLNDGGAGAWNFRQIPRDIMRKVKMAAAHEGKTVKDFVYRSFAFSNSIWGMLD